MPTLLPQSTPGESSGVRGDVNVVADSGEGGRLLLLALLVRSPEVLYRSMGFGPWYSKSAPQWGYVALIVATAP
jgi:hypothetical protein